jgi:elongation factor P
VELRDIQSGTKKNERLRSSESVELAHIDKREEVTLLYREGGLLALMHPTTFEQLEVDAGMLSEQQQVRDATQWRCK